MKCLNIKARVANSRQHWDVFFYYFNFIIGCLSYLIPIIGFFSMLINPNSLTHYSLFSYRLLKDGQYEGMGFLILLIIYALGYFFLYLIPFLLSWLYSLNKFDIQKGNSYTYSLLNSSVLLYFGFNFLLQTHIFYDEIDGFNFLFLILTYLPILFFFLLLNKNAQKFVFKYFSIYKVFYMMVIIVPFYILYISKNNFLELQLYTHVEIIGSKTPSLSKLCISLLYLSPFNLLNFSLFFSINHYLFMKKILTSNYENKVLWMLNYKINYKMRFIIIFYIFIFVITFINLFCNK